MRSFLILLSLILSFPVWAQRNAPVITGQRALSTNEGQPLTIALTDLEVTDRDNWFYPFGFTLAVYQGNNYTVSGATVTPATNFSGTLTVEVTVNDGTYESKRYPLQIQVIDMNSVPVITGQKALSTGPNQAIGIALTDLTVTDADNNYPADFSLIISPGNNYTVSGNAVTPVANFKGTLVVGIKVNDGKADSAPFDLKIEVVDGLRITGQKSLQMNEDETIALQLSDLIVNDPSGTYPTGFTLTISAGSNYTAQAQSVTPALNFNGPLAVTVSVSKGAESSNAFSLQIAVAAVNDAPEISDLETTPIPYNTNSEPVPISMALRITDSDDPQLVLAEIGFRPESYREGSDQFQFTNTTAIRGVFDSKEGILSLIGQAPLEAYQEAIRSVLYSSDSSGTPSQDTKTFYIKLNDGKSVSQVYERSIVMKEIIELDIPNAFTPNSDLANDTWKIRPQQNSEWLASAIVRVYTRRGTLVYEAKGFDQAWDGRFNGQELPPDTYFYTIDLNLTDAQANYKGIVTILR
jgi:gliding motility-associated-like protein